MTKTEATRAFLAKEIQIYVDCLNFSLLNDVVYRGEKDNEFIEKNVINMYIIKNADGIEMAVRAFTDYPISHKVVTPIVKLSEITEDVVKGTAHTETKHLRFTVKLKGSNLCIEKTTDGFSTMELLAACVLLENELAKEKADLMGGGTREEVTHN